MTTRTPDLDTRLLTPEEFERLPDEGWRMELVRGQVVREPPVGFEHGDVAFDGFRCKVSELFGN